MQRIQAFHQLVFSDVKISVKIWVCAGVDHRFCNQTYNLKL